MCIVCLMKKAGMSEEAERLALALFHQMFNQNEVLKLVVESVPALATPALTDCIKTGHMLTLEVATDNPARVLHNTLSPAPDEPQTPNDTFAANNVFPINRTKH